MKMLKRSILLACLMTGSICIPSAHAQPGMTTKVDYTWWEAENPAQSTFPPSDVHPVKNEAKGISGGDWLYADKSAGATATWQVQVASAGDYNFWVLMYDQAGLFQIATVLMTGTGDYKQ